MGSHKEILHGGVIFPTKPIIGFCPSITETLVKVRAIYPKI